MRYSRQSAAMLAPGARAFSTNFSFRLMTRSSPQGIRPEDDRQRCPETFVSAMSWYRTLGGTDGSQLRADSQTASPGVPSGETDLDVVADHLSVLQEPLGGELVETPTDDGGNLGL